MSEEWKDFPGFENKYQISSLGRVKRKETILKNSLGFYYHRKEKILKTQVMSIGYPAITLRDDFGKPLTRFRLFSIKRSLKRTYGKFDKIYSVDFCTREEWEQNRSGDEMHISWSEEK